VTGRRLRIPGCSRVVRAFPPSRRSLFEQFRRLANVYFLVIVVLLMLGTYTPLFDAPLTPYTTLLPLLVVLAVTMGKEGFEDLKRHIADRETNNRDTYLLSSQHKGFFEEVRWQDIRVGRCVRAGVRKWPTMSCLGAYACMCVYARGAGWSRCWIGTRSRQI
jgi:magnesium-transporting ATPase (P-type)